MGSWQTLWTSKCLRRWQIIDFRGPWNSRVGSGGVPLVAVGAVELWKTPGFPRAAVAARQIHSSSEVGVATHRFCRRPLLLSFVRTPLPVGTAPVWDALDVDQRTGIVATLARLIANAAAARSKMGAAADPENHDE